MITMVGASQVVLVVKNLPANAGATRDVDTTPGSGRFLGVRNGNPIYYSCLKNCMDGGACRLHSMGLQRVGHDQVTKCARKRVINTFTSHWKGQCPQERGTVDVNDFSGMPA